MDKPDATTTDIMEFLQDHMVTKEEFRGEINRLDSKINQLDGKINQTKLDILDAMDEKLGSLKGDLIVMMRNEDKKVTMLIEILKQKNVLDKNDVDALSVLQPFPQSIRSA
ncbi:hypothetical protein EPN81_04285 [Patescibacteria group bacterium]|nr:MAG: hypothetical protein EPN81_04285 [Patescibacteria group bacterium]